MATHEPSNPLHDRFAEFTDPPARASVDTPREAPAVDVYADSPTGELDEEQLRWKTADNLYALFDAMRTLPGTASEHSDGVRKHLAFPFNPMFKGAHAMHEGDTVDEGSIERTIDWFRARSAPFAFWWVDERDQPANLGDRLVAQGLAPWEVDAPCLVAELDAMRYELLERVPDGFSMRRVDDEKALNDFVAAFVAGMEVPEWAGQAWLEATRAAGIDHSPWKPYVGYLDGQPVASNMLFCGAGVASVFGVATIPSARGRGIGAAITLIAYQDALQMGYRYGVLFASEMGLPVYQRIGMRAVGTGISRYLWRAT